MDEKNYKNARSITLADVKTLVDSAVREIYSGEQADSGMIIARRLQVRSEIEANAVAAAAAKSLAEEIPTSRIEPFVQRSIDSDTMSRSPNGLIDIILG